MSKRCRAVNLGMRKLGGIIAHAWEEEGPPHFAERMLTKSSVPFITPNDFLLPDL